MHTREHRSLLADAEKRLLIAIARRLPPAINSDHLTLIGLVAMPVAGWCFARIPVKAFSEPPGAEAATKASRSAG